MKNPSYPLAMLRVISRILIAAAIASCAMADDEAMEFDLFNMDHVSTGCVKRDVIWGVCYGRTEKGQVAYAVFYDGTKPSPFVAKIWGRSNGQKGVTLVAEHNGEKIAPPSPEKNILVILQDEVTRGQFEPMDDAEFQDFLRQKDEFSIASLVAFATQDRKGQTTEKPN